MTTEEDDLVIEPLSCIVRTNKKFIFLGNCVSFHLVIKVSPSVAHYRECPNICKKKHGNL